MSDFTEGQIVYDERGATRYYVAPHGDRHLVRSAWTDEYTGDPYPSDSIMEIGQVFSSAPVEHYAAEIRAARAERDEIRMQAAKARDELNALERTRKAARRQFPTSGIIEFLANEVTHVVKTQSYEIVPFDQLKASSAEIAVSVNLRSHPKITLHLHDGSYGGHEVLLATSEEDAEAKLKEHIARKLRDVNYPNLAGSLISAADGHGVPVSDAIRAKHRESRIEGLRKAVANATRNMRQNAANLKEYEAEIAELEGSA